MKRITAFCFVTALLMIALVGFANIRADTLSTDAGIIKEDYGKSYTAHGPIYINGNDDFTEENGVVSGLGTQGNPYIIGGWDINANSAHGIEIRYTDKYFIIRNCIIHDGENNNKYGIYFYSVQNGKIDNVTSYNNYFGIWLYCSSNNQITNCTAYTNDCGIRLNVASDNQITNCNAYNNSFGIHLIYSSNNNQITNCTAYNNSDTGIYLDEDSYYNQIANCSVYNNYDGIHLYDFTALDSSCNQITNCSVYNNHNGIHVCSGSGNTIDTSNIYNNTYGIYLSSYSESHTVSNCNIYNNGDGIYLSHSYKNQIIKCNIYNNSYTGIEMDSDLCGNRIYWNNFINNTQNAYDPSTNYWDNGTVGNYWDNYAGIDANNDHIGDTPYTIDGGSNADNFPLMYEWGKIPPIANFTYSPSIPTTSDAIQFTSTSYDMDTTITSYFWEFGDDNASILQNPTHQYPVKGTYTIILTVTDSGNATNSTSKIITVLNSPPIAGFTYSPINPTDLDIVQFNSTSTDIDGTIVGYYWDFGDGNQSILKNPTHLYSEDDTYTVTLTVTDNDDATGTILQPITILNVPPSLDFTYTPTTPTDLQTVEFTATAIDPDGTITNWYWDFGDGAVSTLQNPTHQYSDDGDYTVTLTVTDNDGATNSTSQIVTVLNVPPIAGFTYSPTIPTDLQLVQFTSLSMDDDGTISSYYWNFGDGRTSTHQNPTHQYFDNGTYTITLTVTDDDGATNTTSKNITVLNVPPVAGFIYSPTIPTTFYTIQFTSTSVDADGIIQSWYWDFGDENASTQENPQHQYLLPNTYMVTLIVTDNDGVTNTSIVFIEVKSGNQKPTTMITYPLEDDTVANTITITGNANDTDGTLQKVEIKIDEGSWQGATGAASWTFNWNTTTISNGSHTIYARSYDGFEYSDIVMVNVTVNNIIVNHAPVVSSINANLTTVSTGGTVTIAVNATDADAGDVLIYVYSSTGGTISGTGNTVTWAAPDTAGTYTVSVYVNDGVVNSDSKDVTITVTSQDGEGDEKGEKGFIPGFETFILLSALGICIMLLKHKKNLNQENLLGE
ncbi:MAG: PKD domain-containing protein [Thermoplasmatales archaeon]|nr:PKD domain-containing protein [Thermoplasmatales archaeon]